MTVIYVTEQGSYLTRKDGRLIVSQGGSVQADVPLAHVEQIVAYGNVHLSAPLMTHCLRERVDVCFLSTQGTYRGRLLPEESRDVRTRRAQYERCNSASFALATARAVVAGKLANQAVFWQRRGGEDGRAAASRLAGLRQKALGSESLEALCGLEGAAAALHFRAFARSLPPALEFSGTRDRPARDPINAMLNLGYTLLYNQMLAALYVASLDPYLGCLHQPKAGHAALASDLMEEFRPVLIDSLVGLLVNHKEIAAADFQTRPDGEARFRDAALRRFLARYQGRLDTIAGYAPQKRRLTYRQILEQQARHFARVVSGTDPQYVPFPWSS